MYIAPEGSTETFSATQMAYEKWKPHYPTSPHWYSAERFQNLLAAYLVADRKAGRLRTVRDVVAEFAGLSGTQARRDVLAATGLHGATLEDLLDGDTMDTVKVHALLRAMQERSKPIQPAALGRLDEAHVRAMLIQQYGIDAETFAWKRQTGVAAGLPWVWELGLGWGDDDRLTLLCGTNFSPALWPPFSGLSDYCDAAEIDCDDPLALCVHLTCPRLDATDRGKSIDTVGQPLFWFLIS
jgi:hypothetical protein